MPSGNRAWCFTLNNPSDDAKAFLQAVPDAPWPHLVQFVCQLEVGASGTPHFQGYCRFNKQRSFGVLQTTLPHGAHIEVAQGSVWQNYVYCTKPDGRLGEPIIFGHFIEPRGPGVGAGSADGGFLKRAEVLRLIATDPSIGINDLIDQGALEAMVTTPNLLGTARGFLLRDLRRNGVTCELYYGPTGTGKSRLADTLYPDAYRKPPGQWFDGYAGELTVILDDFDDASLPVGMLLQLVDRYPFRIPVKGGFIPLVATHFVFTSNLLPSEWYPTLSQRRLDAVHRRFSSVVAFNEDGVAFEYPGSTYFSAPALAARSRFILPWERQSPPHRASSVAPALPVPQNEPHVRAVSPFEFELSDDEEVIIPETPPEDRPVTSDPSTPRDPDPSPQPLFPTQFNWQ